jgi:hypothetical protein
MRARWCSGPRLRLLLAGIALVSLAGCLRPAGEELTELTYQAPVKLTVSPGEEIPGTGIRFVGTSDSDSAEILIEGQQALKRKGDSLDWKGSPVAGTTVDLNLRIAWFDSEALDVVGTAKIEIDQPKVEPVNVPSSALMTYHAPVAYGMAPKALIPGTLYAYVGPTDDGAELGGIEGYPYRKSGDSIVWNGKLREGVYLKLNVRVVQYDDKGLRVGGIATVLLGQ